MKAMKITKDDILKMSKAASRQAEIELGMRRPTSKVHKSLKDYTRKPKHKVAYV